MRIVGVSDSTADAAGTMATADDFLSVDVATVVLGRTDFPPETDVVPKRIKQ